MAKSLLQVPLAKIDDPVLRSLISELEHVSGVVAESHRSLWLYHYLWQCVYPAGASEKRRAIDRARIIPGGILDTKIHKLQSTAVYPLCHELAMKLRSQSVELVENMKLYVFLNRYLPALEKPRNR